jgi:bifunctional DNA-binding transcriptional regulator/antitoxin component of YhaV-PrlF toxin-antitoxin module
MKYLKYFEKKVKYLKAGDIVKLVKKIKAKPNWEIGDFLEIKVVDIGGYNKDLPYEVVPVGSSEYDYHRNSIWVKLDEVEKATDVDIEQKKYNL